MIPASNERDEPAKLINGAAGQSQTGDYVLMTAAYNEEANIEKTIVSVLSQALTPKRWVIVSDGSSDGTDEIIHRYAQNYAFIRFLRVARPPGRSFRSKIMALHQGGSLLDGVTCEFIGNLDADVTVDPAYFSDLIAKFRKRPRLGIAGGFVFEEKDGVFQNRELNRVYAVSHAAQLVRRQCYEDIGGYAVLEYGGEDWHAQVCAKMRGWETEAFPELRILHHRLTGVGDNVLRYKFRQGKMSYGFGSGPAFEILKFVQDVTEKPFLLAAAARLMGFSWSFLTREARPVSDEFIAFVKNGQRRKVLSLFSNGWRQTRMRNTLVKP